MLDSIIQLKVVVLQGGGAARGQAVVGARAVKQKSGTHGPQQNAKRTHDDDGDQDGIQRVQPGVVFL